MKKIVKILWFFVFIYGCDLVDYSPFDVNVPNYKSNSIFLQKMQEDKLKTSKKTSVKIALISDSHLYYKELSDAVAKINTLDSLDFVVHLGDVTERGLKEEYEKFYKIISKLKYSYLVVIGNHDCITNGQVIYKKMFGDFSNYFVYNNILFVYLNNNLWDYTGPIIFDGYNQILEKFTENRTTIVFSHIPPFSEQFNTEQEKLFTDSLAKYNVKLSIHGHTHNYEYLPNKYNNNVDFLIINSVSRRKIVILTLENNCYKLTQLDF